MARVVTLDSARRMELPGRRAQELVGAPVGAQNTTIRLVEIDPLPPGAPERGPHVHIGFEESIHVLSGNGITRTPHGEYPLKPGDTILIPSGEIHATRAVGGETIRLFCFFPVADIRPATREFASWEEALRDA